MQIHVTKSNIEVRAGLVEDRTMFTSLGAVCSVLVDLTAISANWIKEPCNSNNLWPLQG